MPPPAGHGTLLHAPASPGRRAIALVYEALLLIAVVFIGSLPFVMLMHGAEPNIARPLMQTYLVALLGLYFGWQWRHGGQTLALRTWRMRIVTHDGMPLTWKHALKRFAFALPGTLLFGAGFLWALVDREKLFLHDRLAGTRIMMSDE